MIQGICVFKSIQVPKKQYFIVNSFVILYNCLIFSLHAAFSAVTARSSSSLYCLLLYIRSMPSISLLLFSCCWSLFPFNYLPTEIHYLSWCFLGPSTLWHVEVIDFLIPSQSLSMMFSYSHSRSRSAQKLLLSKVLSLFAPQRKAVLNLCGAAHSMIF